MELEEGRRGGWVMGDSRQGVGSRGRKETLGREFGPQAERTPNRFRKKESEQTEDTFLGSSFSL